ncbi:uncharacterized protein [Argopecten irradians]|uniref:uncharacterized protein n=1 Tax=Argopecten irradians TaxID=31199 RepID=UPI003720E381
MAMATSEPESETSTSEPESEPESEPTTMEMVMPTVLILVLGVVVCIFLYCVSHRRRLSTLFSSTKRVKNIQVGEEVSVIRNKNYTFLTSRDLYALQRLESFQNNFCGLVKICIAPGVSLISCPLTLMLYQPLVDYCWPKASFPSPPNINDAIGCFLVPAGMVYAFMFGFAFQHVYQRHSQIGDIIQEKAGVLKELSWIFKNLNGISPATMLEILSILKSQLINELCLVQGIDDQIGADPWSILSLVNKKVTDHTDKLLGLDGSRKMRRTLETEQRTETLMDLALYN